MKLQTSPARFTNKSLNKQVFKYTPLVAAIGTALMMSGCTSSNDQEVYEILTGGGSNTATAVTTGRGGDGGSVDLYKEGGFSKLGIFSDGTADASFTARSVTANLGSNALNVADDTTVAVLAAEPAAGTAYFVAGDTSGDMYISDGDGVLGNDALDTDELPVSGISVAADATLILTPNNTTDPASATGVILELDNDLENNGTLTTADGAGAVRGNLNIDLSSYMGTGNIDTSGTTDGQNGGYVEVDARGIMLVDGDINTAGADSTAADGGRGGDISFYSDYSMQVTGDMDAHGGNGDNGGYGGAIYLRANQSEIWNSGDANTMGGNGDNGGYGGSIRFSAREGGILNSGNLMTSGGTGSVGTGGYGGSIGMYADGGDLISNAELVTRGGAGVTDGGYGGYLNLDQNSSGGSNSLGVSGNIDTRGGDASDPTGSAGGGGDIYFYAEHENNNNENESSNNALHLLGYTQVDSRGGNGASGGDGGSVEMYANYGWYASPYGSTGCGQVINEASINTMGGDSLLTTGTDGDGGNGGEVGLDTCYDYAQDTIDPNTGELVATVTNSGAIDTSGGDNFNATSKFDGHGGSISLYGYNGLTNTADLTANGGNDSASDGGTDGYGGHGGSIGLYAEEPAENSGALTANGGDGEYGGGYAGDVEVNSSIAATNSGDITGNGGNADATLAGSIGGNGAFVEIHAVAIDGTENTGTISHTPGTGATAGDEGTAMVDGQCVSGDCGKPGGGPG